MRFVRLTRWHDGEEILIRASKITSLYTLRPNATARDGFTGTATVAHLGEGSFSDWVREAPREVLELIGASIASPVVAIDEPANEQPAEQPPAATGG